MPIFLNNVNIIYPFKFYIKLISLNRIPKKDFVRLDQDILSPLDGKKQLYTYETIGFWEHNNYTIFFGIMELMKEWS